MINEIPYSLAPLHYLRFESHVSLRDRREIAQTLSNEQQITILMHHNEKPFVFEPQPEDSIESCDGV